MDGMDVFTGTLRGFLCVILNGGKLLQAGVTILLAPRIDPDATASPYGVRDVSLTRTVDEVLAFMQESA